MSSADYLPDPAAVGHTEQAQATEFCHVDDPMGGVRRPPMADSLRAACLAGLAAVATADGDDSDGDDGDDDGGDGSSSSSSSAANVRTTIIVVASLVLGASCVACVLCGLRRRYNRQRASQLVRERAELALHSISAPSSPVTPRPQCAPCPVRQRRRRDGR